jgi:hypothetical protein
LVSPGIPIKDRYKFVYYVQEHINEWMREYYDTDLTELMTDLLLEDRCLSLSNIQNCFC